MYRITFALFALSLAACAPDYHDTADSDTDNGDAPCLVGEPWALQSWVSSPCPGADLGEGCILLDTDGSAWWATWERGNISDATDWHDVGTWDGSGDDYSVCGLDVSVTALYTQSIQTDALSHLYPCPLEP